MDLLDRFASTVKTFVLWAERDEHAGGAGVREALLQLTRLYLAALELPLAMHCDREELADMVEDERVKAWSKVFGNARQLPFDFYDEVFNPLSDQAEGAVAGTLSDDIADIYQDLKEGLRYYHAGRREQALWEWTFSLQVHWGEHVTCAIRALHRWLAENEPSRLSAEK